jgi:hypothetical protein
MRSRGMTPDASTGIGSAHTMGLPLETRNPKSISGSRAWQKYLPRPFGPWHDFPLEGYRHLPERPVLAPELPIIPGRPAGDRNCPPLSAPVDSPNVSPMPSNRRFPDRPGGSGPHGIGRCPVSTGTPYARTPCLLSCPLSDQAMRAIEPAAHAENDSPPRRGNHRIRARSKRYPGLGDHGGSHQYG